MPSTEYPRSERPSRCSQLITSVNCGCRLQIDLLPFALDDGSGDLGRRFALLVLLVGVIELLQAGRALRSMSILEAAVQAVVPHPIAVAIAGLLMQHAGNL